MTNKVGYFGRGTPVDPEILYDAIRELPARCRAAFILFTWHGYDAWDVTDYMAAQGVTMCPQVAMNLIMEGCDHVRRRLEQSAASARATTNLAKTSSFESLRAPAIDWEEGPDPWLN